MTIEVGKLYKCVQEFQSTKFNIKVGDIMMPIKVWHFTGERKLRGKTAWREGTAIEFLVKEKITQIVCQNQNNVWFFRCPGTSDKSD